MQVSVETTEDLGRRMTVQVPAERVDREVERRLSELCGRVKMDGFRPGKVPLKVVRKQYGQQVRSEVLSQVVQETYSEALQQESLRPAAAPHIEPKQLEEGAPLEYEAIFEVLPEVEVTGIEQIRVERPQVEVTDADVEQVLERLRKQHADYEAVERAAAEGDRVVVDFHGTIDGEEFVGNQAQDAALVLGAGQLPQSFEDGLVGVEVGQALTIAHTFPEELPEPSVAGKVAQFHIEIKQIEGPRLPELDDTFAARLGVEEGGVEALQSAVRANLERERDEAVRQRLKRQVLSQLADHNALDLPNGLIDEEIKALREQSGDAEGDLLDTQREAYEEIARRRVKLGLLVNELVRSQEIQIDRERMLRELREMAAQSGQDPREALQEYAQNRRLMEGLEASVIEEQVVDWLLEQVETVARPMPFNELMNPETTDATS